MRHTRSLPRRRDAFTLIELLVVLVLILVIASVGLGYIVFGQDNQHSVNGAQALTGALLNAKQRARRDGLPTGVRIIFPASQQASQLELIQQPDDYNAGLWTSGTGTAASPMTFKNVDFQGGAAYAGEIDESTVQAGDYLVIGGTTTPHQIITVNSATSLTLQSSVPLSPGLPYTIIRAPRRLPSEDIIQMPSNMVIDNSTSPGGSPYCQFIPLRTLTDSSTSKTVAEIVFAPSGAVVGQGTQADKIYLWLRDSSPKLTPTAGMPPGAPLILAVQIRTGLIGVYPVAPCAVNSPFGNGNDPYAYVRSARSSGL